MTSQPCWIVIGDIHEDMAHLASIPELAKAQGVLVTGDITLAKGSTKAAQTLQPLLDCGKPLMIAPGNMDRPEVADWLDSLGIGLHRRVRPFPSGGYCLGLGFSIPTPFGTPGEYPESTFAQWLEATIATEPLLLDKATAWVFSTHTPPVRSACDRLGNGAHVGSEAVRAFIEQYQPPICFCGHIHESVAVDSIGRTTVINPGAFFDGGYALLHFGQKNGNLWFEAELKCL